MIFHINKNTSIFLTIVLACLFFSGCSTLTRPRITGLKGIHDCGNFFFDAFVVVNKTGKDLTNVNMKATLTRSNGDILIFKRSGRVWKNRSEIQLDFPAGDFKRMELEGTCDEGYILNLWYGKKK